MRKKWLEWSENEMKRQSKVWAMKSLQPLFSESLWWKRPCPFQSTVSVRHIMQGWNAENPNYISRSGRNKEFLFWARSTRPNTIHILPLVILSLCFLPWKTSSNNLTISYNGFWFLPQSPGHSFSKGTITEFNSFHYQIFSSKYFI